MRLWLFQVGFGIAAGIGFLIGTHQYESLILNTFLLTVELGWLLSVSAGALRPKQVIPRKIRRTATKVTRMAFTLVALFVCIFLCSYTNSEYAGGIAISTTLVLGSIAVALKAKKRKSQETQEDDP